MKILSKARIFLRILLQSKTAHRNHQKSGRSRQTEVSGLLGATGFGDAAMVLQMEVQKLWVRFSHLNYCIRCQGSSSIRAWGGQT